MDPQGRMVAEVCPGPTSAMHPQARTVDEVRSGPTSAVDPNMDPIIIVKASQAEVQPSRPVSTSRNRGEESDEESDEEPGEEPTEEPVEKWINGVGKKVDSAQPMDHREGLCTIFKVPKHIRRLDPEAYKPVFAYLGPFHHNSRGSSLMKDYKWRYVQHLLSRHRSRERASQLLNECLWELKKQDEKVRSCYSKKFSKLNAQAMTLIMLLDGCFIIYLMLKKKKEEKKKKKKEDLGKLEGEATEEDESKKRRECMIEPREGEVVLNIEEKDEQLEGPTVAGLFTIDVVVYDLLKLENQIPFFIIQLLFDHLKPCEDGLVDLSLQLFKDIHPEESKSFEKKSSREYHHLLHLFYSSRIPSKKLPESTSTSGCIPKLMKCKWKKLEVDAPSQGEAAPSQGSPTSAPKWIPSATELDRAGVKFKKKEQKKEQADSRLNILFQRRKKEQEKKQADSFLNIEFQRRKMKLTPLLCLRKLYIMFRSGRMEIPPLQIYDYTRPLFRNLIAFEQCYVDTEMYITIYTLFMDCIIDQAEDVRLLHLEGILEHRLGNDQAVAELFNQLGSQIHYFSKKIYLANQIVEVNSFYEVKWHKWLAALRRDYFRNPWATISVLAAIFLLFLAIGQAVFSALNYFHRRH